MLTAPPGPPAPADSQAGHRSAAKRGAKVLRTVGSLVLVAAAFGFVLPHVASYRSVWASLQIMTWPYALLVGAAAVASLVSYWLVICSVLPSLRLREAAAMNLCTGAVASTLPAGGVIGIAVGWSMLSSWGGSAADYVLYTLVSGIWNIFVRLGLPVLALLVLMTVSKPGPALIAGAAVGLALLAGMTAGLCLTVRSEVFAARAGELLDRIVSMAARLARRRPVRLNGSLTGFREQAAALLAARGWLISAATVASHLVLWLVLLACLRGIGLPQSVVPWQTSLAAFAFVRLLSALPITPGGLGITELGLVGILAASAGHRATAQVTAAVLLYRAVTYLPTIPLGAAAYLTWRHLPRLIHPAVRGSESDAGDPRPELMTQAL